MGPVIVIPAYNPGRELLTLLDELALAISTKIIVVDDGSRPDTQYIFGEVALRSNVHLLRHGVNLGKGLALKTAFNFFLLTYADHSPGVITVDADGQHLVSDIYKVYYEFVDHPQSVVLGSRTFKEGVPFRSLFGNRMTSQLFHLLSGRKLSDTQTGLRSLPTEFLPKLMRLSGNGYDFET
ncbi:MAG: glycosyltransferase family 2 protein, partial [Bdellovibrionales bacterium]